MTTLKCKEEIVKYGKSDLVIRKEFEEIHCSEEKTCKEGDKKAGCEKRTIIGPSQEDKKFFMGVYACICPDDLKGGKTGRPVPGSHMDCNQYALYYSKDKEELSRLCEMTLCTTEKQCKDGEEKKGCSKRSLIRASKEDDKFFMAIVICVCHQ